MRKLISIILSVVIILGCGINAFASYPDYEFEKLDALKALPENFTLNSEGDNITKAEFAYIAAKISGCTAGGENKEIFADVPADNFYAPYINYLYETSVVCGDENGNFNPEAEVDIFMASKILITVLGYGSLAEANGGYSSGYMDVAYDLGLLKGINVKEGGKLTQKDAIMLCENALFTNVASAGDVLSGMVSKESDETLLSSKFDISVYDGVIKEARQDLASVRFTVEKAKSLCADGNLSVGETLLLEANGNVDINKLEMVPSTIWVDSAGKIIFAYPEKGVEVKYGYIDSINGDTRDGVSYGIDFISRLTMRYDENEYDVSSDAQMKYDNIITKEAVKIVGNYAKVVMKNDEVIFIESWKMKEGGIITNITGTEIFYTKGKDKNLKIDELYKYKRKLIFIDGRSAELSELKLGTVFYYCITDELLAITASEKIVVEKFDGYSDGNIKIGNDTYKKRNVYYSTDLNNYKEDNNLSVLLGLTVKAYLAPDGYVLYIMPDNGESINKVSFYGVVTGVEKDKMDEEEATIRLYKVADKVTEEFFKTDEKTQFIGVSLDTLSANAKDLSGEGLYVFEVNASGKIQKISEPYPFEGFEGKKNVTNFVDGDAEFTSKEGKIIYPGNDVNIVSIYEKDGEFGVCKLAWSDIRGRYVGPNATIEFFGEEEPTDVPSFVLLYGTVGALGQNRVIKYGIITDISDGIDENGELCKVLEVTGSGKNKYNVSPEFARARKVGDFISYYEKTNFYDEPIYLMNTDLIQNFASSPSTWTDVGSFSRGSVSYITDKLVRLADGEAYYFHKSTNFFLEVSVKNGENSFKIIDETDIKYGDEIMYFVSSNAIRGVIKITQ